MPGWQKLYSELKDKNFEIVSVAQDTGGAKDAAPWITAAKPEFTALIDTEHLVTRLYDMVNVPTAVWINPPANTPALPDIAHETAPIEHPSGGWGTPQKMPSSLETSQRQRSAAAVGTPTPR